MNFILRKKALFSFDTFLIKLMWLTVIKCDIMVRKLRFATKKFFSTGINLNSLAKENRKIFLDFRTKIIGGIYENN
jgi:hypothetical protein